MCQRRSAGHGDGETSGETLATGTGGGKGRIFACLFDGLVNL